MTAIAALSSLYAAAGNELPTIDKQMLSEASVFADKMASEPVLIVYRKGFPYGIFTKYQVTIDGEATDTLSNKEVEQFTLTPGSHTVAPKKAKRGVTIQAEPGKTVVVKYATRFGLFGARPKLKVMELGEAQADSDLVK